MAAGLTAYVAPHDSDFLSTRELMAVRGSDASGANDEEPPAEEMECARRMRVGFEGPHAVLACML